MILLVCFLSAILFSEIAECQGKVQIVYEEELTSQTLSGHVQIGESPEGVKNVLVEVCNPAWKESLVSTKTDSDGNFSFPALKSKKLYYLRLSSYAMNTMLVKVRVKALGSKRVNLRLEPST